MSTIKVNKIENTATADGGIAIDSSGHVQADGLQMPTAGALSNRNLIINGAMQVAQRGTSTTGVASSGYYSVDRMSLGISSLGAYTVTQESDGPAGFAKSYKIDCTTADSSPAAGNFIKLDYNIEGQDLQNLDYGASTAKALTFTFYVKSNKTGNASFEVQQKNNSDRQITPQYTINAANTWEKKTISIPADTAGLINDDNGTGLRITWWLNSGSTYQGGSHQTTWVAEVDADRNVSNLGIGGSTSDYWQITGLQLEVGEKATPFEHRSYGDELRRCQRYLFRVNGNSDDQTAIALAHNNTTSNCRGVVHLPVSMRSVNQTVSESGLDSLYDNSNTVGVDIFGFDEGINAVAFFCTAASGSPFTVGRVNYLRLYNSTTAFFQVESEL